MDDRRWGDGFDEIVAILRGPPYHLNPHFVLESMTLPQCLYMCVKGEQHIARDRQMLLVIMLTATATAFGSDKDQVLYHHMMNLLEGREEVMDVTQWSDELKLVMYGSSRYRGQGDGQ